MFKILFISALALATSLSFASEVKHSNCLLKGVVSTNSEKESHLKEILESRGYKISSEANESPGLFVTSFAIPKALGFTQLTFDIVDNTVFPSRVISSKSEFTRSSNEVEKHYELMDKIPNCVIQ